MSESAAIVQSQRAAPGVRLRVAVSGCSMLIPVTGDWATDRQVSTLLQTIQRAEAAVLFSPQPTVWIGCSDPATPAHLLILGFVSQLTGLSQLPPVVLLRWNH